MQKKFNKNDGAVSPVVAVMLMLVITIIIAALVSAFAGGLTDTTDKAANVVIKGTFSQAAGLEIRHISGDTINTADTTITVRPTKDFGNYDHLVWTLNRSTMFDDFANIDKDGYVRNNRAWVVPVGSMYTSSLVPQFSVGDAVYINATNVQKVGDSGNPALSNAFNFTRPDNAGKKISIEMQNNGKTIAKTTMKIVA